MPRKWILAAIGGGETAGPEVEAFGRLVAHVGAILMTGGVPKQNSSAVTERAQFGCKAAGGLMISVLPNKDPNKIDRCTGERRFEVRTKTSKYGRDPITGAAADMIFVFPGEVGTLVELAYASKAERPIVFCGTEAQWKKMDEVRKDKRTEIREAIQKAISEYRPDSNCADLKRDQVTQAADHLEQKLKEALQKNNLGTTAHFLQSFLQVCSAPAPADTNFQGLPDCSGVEEFRGLVDELSAFGPNGCFP